MALRLAKTVKGFEYSYWRITEISGIINSVFVVTLGLFKDYESARSTDNAILSLRFSMIIPKEEILAGSLLQFAYNESKTREEMFDAEDIHE